LRKQGGPVTVLPFTGMQMPPEAAGTSIGVDRPQLRSTPRIACCRIPISC